MRHGAVGPWTELLLRTWRLQLRARQAGGQIDLLDRSDLRPQGAAKSHMSPTFSLSQCSMNWSARPALLIAQYLSERRGSHRNPSSTRTFLLRPRHVVVACSHLSPSFLSGEAEAAFTVICTWHGDCFRGTFFGLCNPLD